MEDLAGAREVMKRLNRLGVRLAIDDFGTGHSSLAYLKQFPVHEVKVDRVFVAGIAESPVDSAIVRAVIELANAMGIATVAEGVESRDQVAELRRLGCEVAQGLYFSPPLRAGEFDALLARHFAPAVRPGAPAVSLAQPARCAQAASSSSVASSSARQRRNAWTSTSGQAASNSAASKWNRDIA
jgi:predicted signal transduction protein with EAL and GGDEF domain